jgi:hypothetical protein
MTTVAVTAELVDSLTGPSAAPRRSRPGPVPGRPGLRDLSRQLARLDRSTR